MKWNGLFAKSVSFQHVGQKKNNSIPLHLQSKYSSVVRAVFL